MLAELPVSPVCDFCSTPLDATARCFLAAGAQLRVEDPESGKRKLTLNSDAHWAACAVCAPVIERRDRAGILKRSKELAPKGEDGMQGMSVEALAYIQESMFWAHFTGEEHPASEHPSEHSI
jgi:hypothetical protein